MGVGNMFVLIQTTFYLLVLIFAFLTLVPLSVYNTQFSGHCLLYAGGEWSTDNTSESVLTVQWGDDGYCRFPIFLSVVTLPLSFAYVLILSVHLYKDTNASWGATFLMVIITWLFMLLALVTGIIVTDGFGKWCTLLGQQGFDCDDAEFINFKIEKDVTKTGFFVEFEMAKATIWMSWICWTFLALMASYKLYDFHRQEDFFISMRRERQRLLARTTSTDHAEREALYT